MITMFVRDLLDYLDNFIHFMHIDDTFNFVNSVLTLLNNNASYIQTALGIVYFFIGKNVCIALLVGFYVIFMFRLVMAIINLIGQFVP